MNNRILKGEEFYQRYGVSPEGLVLWLDQSDVRSYGDAQNWYDLSGKANHAVQGTASQQPAITGCQEFAGTARYADGIDDIMIISSSDSLKMTRGTLEAWFNFPTVSAITEEIITKHTNYGLRKYTSNLLHISFYNGAWNTCPSVTTLQANQWYYGVGSNDGVDLKVYLNGILENTVNVNKDFLTSDNDAELFNGWDNTYYNGYGVIFRIWNNRLLTEAEVRRLYLKDAPRFGLL